MFWNHESINHESGVISVMIFLNVINNNESDNMQKTVNHVAMSLIQKIWVGVMVVVLLVMLQSPMDPLW